VSLLLFPGIRLFRFLQQNTSEKSITRAEAAVIFAKLLGANENTKINYNVSYTDVDSSHWASWAIKFVSYKKLFTGYPDGSFKPNQNITRAEFSTVVFKLLVSEKGLKEEKIEKSKFGDTKGHWHNSLLNSCQTLDTSTDILMVHSSPTTISNDQKVLP